MHRKSWFVLMFFAIALFALCYDVRAASSVGASVDSRLSQADSVRSSNPLQFTALLDGLEKSGDAIAPDQKERLQYLQAYRQGVYNDRLDEGISLAQTLSETTENVTLKYRADSLIATFSAMKRDFTMGLRYLNAAMALRSKIKEKDIRQEGVGSAAVLYNQLGQYKIGLRYADEILSDSPRPRVRCGAAYVRVESLFELGLLRGDTSQAAQVVVACEKINEKIISSYATLIIVKQKLASGLGNDAMLLLEKVLPDIESTRYPRLIGDAKSLLAEIKLKLGDTKSARAYSLETISLGDQIKSTNALVSAYFTLYQLANMQGDAVGALGMYKKYAEADKSHVNDVKARELAFEIVRYETQQKNKEIELLQQTNQVLRLRQSLDRENAQKARLATIFLLIVLAGIVFWALQIKRHHRQLQALAQTDSLTGLGNRHFFTQMSEKALVDAARAGEPASLVMFDLDHFKAINDTYGHGAGDWVLKQVGKTCSMHCRKIDFLGRIGGEEFAVLLRGIDLSGATRIAEDCRVQLAKIDTRECGYAFVVTGSFGVSSTAQSGYDLSRLLSHADQMLYRAKNEGRNRVCANTADAAIDHRSNKRSPTLSIVNR